MSKPSIPRAILTLWITCNVSSALAASGGLFTNKLNPAISMNSVLEARHFVDQEEPSAMGLREAELRISSAVDPFFELHSSLVFGHHEGEFEELYVLNQPWAGWELKAGKFKAAFGRHALLHSHAFPFIDAPLAQALVLGEEGYNDVGLEASWLIPLPFFLEWGAGVYNGIKPEEPGEGLDLGSEDDERLAFSSRFKVFLELDEITTLELGSSVLGGQDSQEIRKIIGGAHLALKHLPANRESQAWELQAEWFKPIHKERTPYLVAAFTFLNSPSLASPQGGYLHGRWKLSRNWWIGSRFGRALAEGLPWLHQGSFELAYVPSEYSAVRLDYTYRSDAQGYSGQLNRMISFQTVFSIGSHPAHAY